MLFNVNSDREVTGRFVQGPDLVDFSAEFRLKLHAPFLSLIHSQGESPFDSTESAYHAGRVW